MWISCYVRYFVWVCFAHLLWLTSEKMFACIICVVLCCRQTWSVQTVSWQYKVLSKCVCVCVCDCIHECRYTYSVYPCIETTTNHLSMCPLCNRSQVETDGKRKHPTALTLIREHGMYVCHMTVSDNEIIYVFLIQSNCISSQMWNNFPKSLLVLREGAFIVGVPGRIWVQANLHLRLCLPLPKSLAILPAILM